MSQPETIHRLAFQSALQATTHAQMSQNPDVRGVFESPVAKESGMKIILVDFPDKTSLTGVRFKPVLTPLSATASDFVPTLVFDVAGTLSTPTLRLASEVVRETYMYSRFMNRNFDDSFEEMCKKAIEAQCAFLDEKQVEVGEEKDPRSRALQDLLPFILGQGRFRNDCSFERFCHVLREQKFDLPGEDAAKKKLIQDPWLFVQARELVLDQVFGDNDGTRDPRTLDESRDTASKLYAFNAIVLVNSGMLTS